MKANHFYIFLALVIISLPIILNAQTLPYGGRVGQTVFCNEGELLTVQTSFGSLQLLWRYGELPYMYFVIPHPGQNMIGRYSPILSVCTIGNSVYGYGFPISFHGESY